MLYSAGRSTATADAMPPLRRFAMILFGLSLGVALMLLPSGPVAADEFTPEQRRAIEAIVKDYLLKNPQTLLEALQAAEDKLKGEAKDKASAALATHRQQVFDDPDTPIAGNPHGDASLVEFFDYRCPYCKQVEPSLEALLTTDQQLRFVYKEFPVLGPESVTAARAALAARQQGKYDALHRALMGLKGQMDDATIFAAASSVGLDVGRLKHDMTAPDIDRILKANLQLAQVLDIRGTPGFVIGDQIVPGAIGLDELKQLIGEARHK